MDKTIKEILAQTPCKEYIFYDKGAEPLQHYRALTIIFTSVLSAITLACAILLIVGLCINDDTMFSVSLMAFILLLLTSFCFIFQCIYNSSKIKIFNEGIAYLRKLRKPQFFYWKDICQIHPIKLYSTSSKGSSMTLEFIIIQTDWTIYKERERSDNVVNDPHNIILAYSKERYDTILDYWNKFKIQQAEMIEQWNKYGRPSEALKSPSNAPEAEITTADKTETGTPEAQDKE